ncbi:MAG TPA: helix-turn-helix domain-containing protein [Acidimicrobiales bacterium]|nr:helix-turn-helix domain-containing protein [Acidimicrobiales bacterium]
MTGFPHLSDAVPQLARPEEVAEYLGFTVDAVQRQLRRGELPGVKVGGRWFVHVGRLRAQLGEQSAS